MNKTKIKAVIFDMDGVIVDSEPLNSKSWEILLQEKGITPILYENGLIHEVGDTRPDSYQRIIDKHNLKEDIETIRSRRRDIFVELIKKKTDVNPGFMELVAMLQKNKIRIAVASSRLFDHVQIILNNLKVIDLFEVVIGQVPFLKRKPEPDIYLYAAEKLGVKPEECVALEDSETGVLSAKNAGMKIIAIPNQYTHHQNFSKADKIVASLKEINISLLMSLRGTK